MRYSPLLLLSVVSALAVYSYSARDGIVCGPDSPAGPTVGSKFAIAGCVTTTVKSDLIAAGRAAVIAKLIDPRSAQFTDVRSVVSNGHQFVCGQVAAKNRIGGYDSPRPFIFDPKLAQGAIIYEGESITNDAISGMAQRKGYLNACDG